jgi:hypothetical protein
MRSHFLTPPLIEQRGATVVGQSSSDAHSSVGNWQANESEGQPGCFS